MAVPEWQHEYETLALSAPRPGVVHVELNRPRKANASMSTNKRACNWRQLRPIAASHVTFVFFVELFT